ncbi:four-carbon acid sugar kinase family protein, partial [Streptomyces albidus (ex Kaewkla and Franco 2022)]|uniref:four-carbon acid sugar kinase family protein n=1 Tax=Streptomyces albidus (ex Kaewkla and Franco 2022) TaxID=722709 RepID=UPI0015EED0F9
MAQVLVVADDLTGSNATGALFARLGLRTITVSDLAQIPRYADGVDVLVVNTGSRHFPAAQSYAAVHEVTSLAAGESLVVKRVDTTLRGNPGRELDAAVDAVTADKPSTPVRVLAVPAFPDAGRTTVGGIHLVDGVPLTRTPVAHDPFDSVRHSRIAAVLGEQSSRTTAEIPLDVVEDGPDAVLDALRRPAGVLVCDATENEHLRTVAAAAARLTAQDGTRWVSLDSGPFGAALAAELGIRPSGPAPAPVLAIVGSATDATHEQLARSEKALGARYVLLDPDDAAPDPARIVRELRAAADA